ncbi:MAG TPA: metallophosphoesterase [Kiritimatiellia bacterium]|nr:metallophosphoesterase [Kiritimatiellia bacterium]
MHKWVGMALAVVLAARADAQLLATDNFESYTNNPIGQPGGSGGWTGYWGFNSQLDGGAFLDSAFRIDGTKSIGLFGNGGSSGTSVSRPFPACTNSLVIRSSFRGNFNLHSDNPPSNRRMAFTIRSGNEASHFGGQRLSFFFAQGSTNLQWYDGVDRGTNAVIFANGDTYDLQVSLNPVTRAYSFTISNRNTSATHSYAGNWTIGAAGDPIGSVSFLMRGPTGAGNDAFLDSVSVDAPDFVEPPLQSLPLLEGDLWRYFKGTSTPATQGTNQWYRPEYLDGAWGGPAPSGFGYGDCDDATVLSDMQNSYISVFTRKAFRVDNPGSISHLTLAVDVDDGCVAHLNGVEVARVNMPAGTITRHTAASSARESSRGEGNSPPTEKTFFALDPALLVAGTNVIAVSGHNVSTNSSDFTLIVELYTNASLVRGPFIQMPDAGNTAAIVWRTAALTDSVVEYGLDLTYGSGVVSNGSLTRDHTVHLAGLIPGASYFYRVRSNGEILSEGNAFRTRPVAGQPFRVVVIGDHGQGTAGMYAIADRVNARSDYDAIFTVGDNIYGISPCNMDGAPGWYDPYWFKLYGPAMRRVSTFPTLGNHDWDTAGGQYMVDYFRLPTNGPAGLIGKNYSFEFGNMHVISIDTEPYEDNSNLVMNAINAWIEADLATATQQWRVALLHRPPYTSQGNHDDNARVKQHIVPRLKAGGVHIVFQGHNHFYERINAIDGTHYVTTAGAGAFLYGFPNIKEYSAARHNAGHSYTVLDIDGPRMRIEQFSDADVLLDSFTYEIAPPFALDGLLDNPSWLRASNGLNLYAAIHGNRLYVATQDAGEGNDHFIYLASMVSTQRPANWSKSGTIMQWGVFLADENDGGFHGWFNDAGAPLPNGLLYNSMTSGLNNNGTNGNGVLEGVIDLAAHFGSFPTQLLVAVAPYGTLDAGSLVNSAQVPAGNGNGNIEANEFLALAARDLALDLPVPVASPPAPMEAGLPMTVDGSASYSPSGLPLSFAWSQVSGTPGVFAATNAALSTFTLAANVSGVETVVVRLVVHDGRFGEELPVNLVFSEMLDSDGDGLSDGEELTGLDNALTPLNPNGFITNPALPDSDGDGMTDGQEAIAGTDPNDGNSLFKFVSQQSDAGSGLVIRWASVADRVYAVWSATNLFSAWSPLATNLPGVPPVNSYTTTVGDAAHFFAVETAAP